MPTIRTKVHLTRPSGSERLARGRSEVGDPDVKSAALTLLAVAATLVRHGMWRLITSMDGA